MSAIAKRIGALRQRLSIEREILTPDGGGGFVATWEEIARVWGAVEAGAGRERVEADRVTGRVGHHITIRYREGVTPSMRFRRGDAVFDILGVADKDGRRRFLACQCERRDL
jgi:SPP1 family predicted phage head-tail adaptor